MAHHQLLTSSAALPASQGAWGGCRASLRPPVGPCRRLAPSFRGSAFSCSAVRERVLRYPDGHERRILYPAAATVDEELDELPDAAAGCWFGRGAAAAAAADASLQQRGPRQGPEGGTGPAGSHMGRASTSEPSLQETAAFLEGLFAASYAAQPLVDVEGCYEVLEGCPWVLPRPVFVLTSEGWGLQAADGIHSTYTLRVKVAQEGAADAIAQLLNKQHLSNALEVCLMRDGLVMFTSAEDADRFASLLEEEGHSQVMVAEVDSHRAFRLVCDAKALAVVMREGAGVPAPYQLAASLKKHRSLDSSR